MSVHEVIKEISTEWKLVKMRMSERPGKEVGWTEQQLVTPAYLHIWPFSPCLLLGIYKYIYEKKEEKKKDRNKAVGDKRKGKRVGVKTRSETEKTYNLLLYF